MRELSDVLHQNLSQEVILAASQRKAILCQKIYVQLVQCFTQANPEAPRRWSGQFILELIRGFDKNKCYFVSMRDGVRGILDVIFNDDHQCLRIIAATIIKELATAKSKLPALSAIDTRIELLKKCSGFLLPACGGQWAKGILAVISAVGQPLQGAFYAQAVSIEGLVESINAVDGLIFTFSHNNLTILTTCDYQFKFIDIPLSSIGSAKAEGNKMMICLGYNGYYITDGSKLYSNSLLIGPAELDHVHAAIESIEQMKGESVIALAHMDMMLISDIAREDRNKVALYKEPNEGAVAIIAFEDCGVNEHMPWVLHGSKHTSSDNDSTTSLWTGNHRPPSSAIVELPTGEEVLCASQLFISSNNLAKSQEQHKWPSEQRTPCREPHLRDEPEIGGVNAGSHRHEASPELDSSLNPLGQPLHPLALQANDEEVTVSQTSPTSSSSTFLHPKFEVARVDRAAGSLSDLPNLAMQAILLQPQHLNSNSQASRIPTENTPCVEESPCCRTVPTAEIATLVPNSQPTGNPTTIGNPTAIMTNSGANKTPQESGKTGSESNSISNSRLKRPIHKLCSPSTKKADVDWDEDLRVDTETPPAPIHAPSNNPNSKEASGSGELVSASKGKKKPSSKAKQNINTLKLVSQIGGVLTKQNKRPNRQVTKTLTSGRQPRSAAEAANKKMALATKRENATYDLDDPIESSYPGSTSLEDLADYTQIEDNLVINSVQPLKICATMTEKIASDKDSSDRSGGVSIACGKNMVFGKSNLSTASQTAAEKSTLSYQPNGAKGEDAEESVINLCSDSLPEEDGDQMGQNENDQPSKLKTLNQAVSCPPGAAPAGLEMKLSGVVGSLSTTLSSVSEKKRTVENTSQVSKNVSQFMSQNLASAQSNNRKPGPGQPGYQDNPRLEKDNFDVMWAKSARPTPKKLPPEAVEMHSQKPMRSVKFDLAEDHIQASMHASTISSDNSTSPFRDTSRAEYKATTLSPTRNKKSSSLSGLADDTFIASGSYGDLDEELGSSSIHKPKKHSPMRARLIGWQSRTVDENGSPIPRLQAVHNFHNKNSPESSESRKEKGQAYIDLPSSVSFPRHPQKEQGGVALNYSACKPLINGPRDGLAHRRDHEIPSNLGTKLRRGRQYNSSMKTSDLFHPKVMCHEKLEEPQSSVTMAQKRSLRLLERLKANKTKSASQNVKKRPLISVRNSQRFKSMGNGGDDVDTEVDTDDEGSTPPRRQECPEHVEYRELEWEKRLRENYRGGRDLLLNTSKRLSQELCDSENKLFHSVDIYRIGCNSMIDQLEEIHSEKLDQCEHTLRPIKKRFLGMFENFSKRLDNDHRSIQETSTNLTSKNQRKIAGKIDAAIEEYSSKLAKVANA
ncbi:hypothetical protein MferCBS31731_007186 [Microsporum ferrugineum]